MGARLLSHPSELVLDMISADPGCVGWRLEDLGLLGIPVEKSFLSRITGLKQETFESNIQMTDKPFIVESAGDSRIIFRKR